MRIYVIGPVSGFADLNLPAFEDARRKLRHADYIPLIPHDFVSDDSDWQQAMRRSLETLAKADGIAYLEGWQKSHGARLEWMIARALGIEVASVDSWCATSSYRIAIMRRAKERKRCPYCKRILPLDLFDQASGKADKHQVYCRDCMTDYKRERRDLEQT